MANETTQAHTPGEYIASPRGEGDDWDIWTVDPEKLLATVYGDFDVTAAEGKANARLIAAAPDLLALLVRVKHELEYPDDFGDDLDAAIAKASQVPQE